MRSQRSCSEKTEIKESLHLFSLITTGQHTNLFFFPKWITNWLKPLWYMSENGFYTIQKLSAEALLWEGVLSAFGKYTWHPPLSHILEEVTTAFFLTFFIKNWHLSPEGTFPVTTLKSHWIQTEQKWTARNSTANRGEKWRQNEWSAHNQDLG